MNSIDDINVSSWAPIFSLCLSWCTASTILRVHWISIETKRPSVKSGSPFGKILYSPCRSNNSLLEFSIDIHQHAFIVPLILITACKSHFCICPESHSLRRLQQYDHWPLSVDFLMKVHITGSVDTHQIHSLEPYTCVNTIDLLHHKLCINWIL